MEETLPFNTICFDCAEAKGGVAPTYAITVSEDCCPYCNERKTVTSISDFDWPKLGRRAVWD